MADRSERLARRVLGRCERLPQAVLAFPFGPDPSVFTIGGRMFALFALEAEPVRVSVKCAPDYAAALVAEHAAIVPGYHLNKRHWITVDLTGELPDGLVEELVVDSYHLVLDGLPRSRRPQ